MNSPRQTVSYLISRFREAGLRPDTRKGQNFLIDLNLVELLARAADIGPHDVVLEIGTGLGSLTAILARQAAAVVTVEVDARVQQLASEVLTEYSNVTMLRQDALRNKNHLHDAVLAAVQTQLDAAPGRVFKLAANLPYNIATPVLSNLLSTRLTPATMTVTIQKEVAERLAAKPSTKDYSALSIWMQLQCDIEVVRVLAPSVFWPRPKVHSAIVQIRPNPVKRARLSDPEFLHAFLRAMFFHRRKFLRGELVSACKERLDKAGVDALMVEQGLGPETRAEQLDPETMLRLCEAARRALQGAAPLAPPDDDNAAPG